MQGRRTERLHADSARRQLGWVRGVTQSREGANHVYFEGPVPGKRQESR